ncbi:MAG: hypothetical protein RR365_02090 [Bacteroides sp.]
MGLVDIFNAEDRVSVKFSDFYALIKGCAEREIISNGLRYKIPHAHIQAMLGELTEERSESTQADIIITNREETK